MNYCASRYDCKKCGKTFQIGYPVTKPPYKNNEINYINGPCIHWCPECGSGLDSGIAHKMISTLTKGSDIIWDIDKKGLTLKELQAINVKRCNECFDGVDNWSESDWGNALSGEVGELCNFIKKRRRGENIPVESLAKELADIQCYLVLIAEKLKVDLEEVTKQKFNEVSDRVFSNIKIG